MTQSLRVWIQGVGVLAPGVHNWAQLQQIWQNAEAYVEAPAVLPAPELLPSAERRRASRVIKVAMAVASEAVQQAHVQAADLATVFTSSTGDGTNCHALCETLAGDRMVSPTRFHNSVHNTAAGYWCIAVGAKKACQVLAGYDGSFSVGLYEAAVQVAVDQEPLLLVSYDNDYPEPLFSARPVTDAAGIALVLGPTRTETSLACCDITWETHSGGGVSNVAPEALDALRDKIPCLRGLPLLQALVQAGSSTVLLESVKGQALRVQVTPC